MPETFSVLIVEDDEDARVNMEDILSLDGYQIQSASDYLNAESEIAERHFDAVIVDWQLPDGNGGDLLPVIKRDLPNSPVIIVTGFREFNTAVTALRRGAYDFLTKPINPDALRALINRLVERKSHLREIELGNQQLVSTERLAAIGQMVAGLAHESRNAFQRSHACLAELSLDLQDMPDSLKLVGKVQKALDDVNQLLEEVRNYASPIILEWRECNLKSLVEESWQQILEAKQIASVKMDIKTDDPFPEAIRVDRNRMIQVFRNLLENALFAGGVTEKVLIELAVMPLAGKRSTPVFSISVSDSGAGVPVENREDIFTPFFTTKTKGTGLGLAICRRIVESHKGRLYVTDSETGGAKFVVELPVVTGASSRR